MKIGGLQKVSLIDFPGKIACVVFAQGCNFRCQFCHNQILVVPQKFEKLTEEEEVFDFLGGRVSKIDAVVVSGGEPTLHNDLWKFLEKIKAMGFMVKLDTNGTSPTVLEDLYGKHLLDYVAMDIKHRFEKYGEIVCAEADIEKIKLSVALVKSGSVDYEFRTTVVPKFHGDDDIKAIAEQLSGAKRFIIQEFVPGHAMDGSLSNANSIFAVENREILNGVANFCRTHVDEFAWRVAN
ncbi:MAG: anaerobic ribonucleoside-triphosphate reductase activating protein [Puniceicoccales bacterium]|jgi:pyruvate formate lyase activating enzyme|nr:anaerobic ribonucleoside-triphosphate reductase activating protein [Puniceicoccales bacterium]